MAAWIAERFGSLSRGRRVYWDSSEPVSGRPGEHRPPFFGYAPLIRLTSGDDLSGVEKCVVLIYELHNLARYPEFLDVLYRARRGKIGREEFALSCSRIEYAAIGDTQEFLREHPLTSVDDPFHPFCRDLLAYPKSFDDWVRWLDQRGPGEYDPRDYFARLYDEYTQYIRESRAPFP